MSTSAPPDRIDASRAALIVYDACRRALAPADPARRAAMRPVLDAWVTLIGGCRAHGLPIIYTTPVSRADGADVVLLPTDLSVQTGVPSLTNCIEGTPEAGFPEAIAPRPQDYVFLKRRPSAFYGTGVAELLRLLRRTALVIGGGATNRGVETSVREAGALLERFEHRVGDLCAHDGIGRDDHVAIDAVARPRPVARARPGGGETGHVQAPELPALDELVTRRDLLQHARRRVPGAQEVQSEVTEARIGAGLGDDGAHPRRDVDAPRADGHFVGRDGDAEHAAALAPADERERRELDADHGPTLAFPPHAGCSPFVASVNRRTAATEADASSPAMAATSSS